MPTKIEWAEETWNPVTGCTKISAGCTHCYAERMSKRLRGRFGYDQDDPFKVTWHGDKLEQPLKWRKPRRIFVCSMGDLFHKDVPYIWISMVLGIASQANRDHTFLFLTKRPDRMKKHMMDWAGAQGSLPGNWWLGVTAENQRQADIRIPYLLSIPAAVRFVSLEPLLGAVDMDHDSDTCHCGTAMDEHYFETHGAVPLPSSYLIEGLDWVIAGAETGPGARPMDLDWARSIRDQCQHAGTPYFFKRDSDGNRELDGVKWNEFPR